VNQSKLEANTCSWHEVQENVCERDTTGFGFSSDWLRKWREIFKPISKRSNAKPMQTQFTFDTQVKTTLNIHVKLANVEKTLSVRFENYHPTVYKLHDSV
jgi:hypothetical protein